MKVLGEVEESTRRRKGKVREAGRGQGHEVYEEQDRKVRGQGQEIYEEQDRKVRGQGQEIYEEQDRKSMSRMTGKIEFQGNG